MLYGPSGTSTDLVPPRDWQLDITTYKQLLNYCSGYEDISLSAWVAESISITIICTTIPPRFVK